jgi:hypothetical protein
MPRRISVGEASGQLGRLRQPDNNPVGLVDRAGSCRPRQLGGGAVVVTGRAEEELSWTVLGRRMGFTSTRRQREQILTAIHTMTWADADPTLHIEGAAGAVIAALLGRRRDRLRCIGVAGLGAGRRLIGLQDDRGARRFVLDLDSEAIYVLAAAPLHRTARPNAA